MASLKTFSAWDMQALEGNLGIGHVRYPTAGTSSTREAQPLYVNYPYGIAFGHNGNLTNADALKALLQGNLRHLNTHSDSEILLNVFAHELAEQAVDALQPSLLKRFKAYTTLSRRICSRQ